MKRPFSICLTAALALALSGCGSEGTALTEGTAPAENTVALYQVEGDQIALTDNLQLKTPDSLSSCAEDIMTALTAEDTSIIDSYTYMLGDDNSLELELTLKDGTYTQEDTLLMMAAVTQSMFQLRDITSISLSVQDHSGASVEEEQLFLRSSFYYYDSDEKSLSAEDIRIFVPNSAGTALTPLTIRMQISPQTSDQELIVQELVRRGVLPANTKVNQVSVHDSVCYLDLSGEFLYSVGNSTPELVLYSLVNSVISQTGVDTVQLMIDGTIESSYRNAADISQPLSYNSNIVETQE